MVNDLKEYFDAAESEFISSAHKKQEDLYGVYSPPTLKQLVSLKHLLTCIGNQDELQPEDLLGLSKTQCTLLSQKLFKKYRNQRRGGE